MSSAHLWLALSPHGYGHAVMTAPPVAELRRRIPGLRLTIQTAISRDFLETRYGADFAHVPEIADFGLRMTSATGIDLEASVAGYLAMHAGWEALVESEAARLRSAAPDLVLANIPYVTLAAASRAGIPAVACSSLNWLDVVGHYLGHREEMSPVLAQMRAAYASAEVFLQATPSMAMSLPNRRAVGVLARRVPRRKEALRAALGVGEERRVGLVAFGGIDHPLPFERWPRLDGWTWLTAQPCPPRPDLAHWPAGGMPFGDLIGAVDLVVTKPGYGTFTEAGTAGTAVLYLPRPDWPESPHLDRWLANHSRSETIDPEGLFDGRLEAQLQKLFSQPVPRVAIPTGADEVAALLERRLAGERIACGRS